MASRFVSRKYTNGCCTEGHKDYNLMIAKWFPTPDIIQELSLGQMTKGVENGVYQEIGTLVSNNPF